MEKTKKSMVGLAFVKQYVTPHLQPYAHLVPATVNDHVGWMDWPQKKLALLIGMDALRQAWEKWQETPEKFTEKQFFGYAKIIIRRRILDDCRKEIAARQGMIENSRFIREYHEAEAQQLQEDLSKSRSRQTPTSPLIPSDVHQQKPVRVPVGERSLSGILQTVTRDTRRVPNRNEYLDDEDYEDYEDYEQEEWADESITFDKDEEGGYVNSVRVITTSNADKLRRLLPEREALMLKLTGQGQPIALVSKTWGISRVRGSQIHKQAMDRLEGYLVRLKNGEVFDDLLAESQRAEATANKKQKKFSEKAD